MKLTREYFLVEVEVEKPVPDLGGEICRRIAMHPHVHDANIISVKKLNEVQPPVTVNLTDTRNVTGSD